MYIMNYRKSMTDRGRLHTLVVDLKEVFVKKFNITKMYILIFIYNKL